MFDMVTFAQHEANDMGFVHAHDGVLKWDAREVEILVDILRPELGGVESVDHTIHHPLPAAVGYVGPA